MACAGPTERNKQTSIAGFAGEKWKNKVDIWLKQFRRRRVIFLTRSFSASSVLTQRTRKQPALKTKFCNLRICPTSVKNLTHSPVADFKKKLRFSKKKKKKKE